MILLAAGYCSFRGEHWVLVNLQQVLVSYSMWNLTWHSRKSYMGRSINYKMSETCEHKENELYTILL